MRQIVLDTETTGLDVVRDSILEIGAVELVDGLPTGRKFHRYVDPGRSIHSDALAVHGIDAEKLKAENAKPFAAIADELMEFIGDAPLVMHNASFDLKFLNAGLQGCGRPAIAKSRAICTLVMARQKYPAKQASLDALCKRFFGNAPRGKHSALEDAELLAEVYIELRGGRQSELSVAVETKARVLDGITPAQWQPRLVQPSEAEIAAHAAFIATIPGAIWGAI